MRFFKLYIELVANRYCARARSIHLKNFISDPPKVRLSLGSSINPESISEGNDVYMDCEIRANPKAYKVEWSHNVRNKNIFTNRHDKT